jgi:hypothetical protein
MGTRLPSEEYVLIIRLAGIEGLPPLRSNRFTLCLPGLPARKRGISEQDQSAVRSRRNAVAADIDTRFPKRYFPKA